MNFHIIKGYVLVIATGLLLLAGALLVILQAQNRAEFSLYGQNISIRFQQDGKCIGGVNTAFLMVCSAAGGLLAVPLLRVMVSGLRSVAKDRRQRQQAQAAKAPPPEKTQEHEATGK